MPPSLGEGPRAGVAPNLLLRGTVLFSPPRFSWIQAASGCLLQLKPCFIICLELV